MKLRSALVEEGLDAFVIITRLTKLAHGVAFNEQLLLQC